MELFKSFSFRSERVTLPPCNIHDVFRNSIPLPGFDVKAVPHFSSSLSKKKTLSSLRLVSNCNPTPKHKNFSTKYFFTSLLVVVVFLHVFRDETDLHVLMLRSHEL